MPRDFSRRTFLASTAAAAIAGPAVLTHGQRLMAADAGNSLRLRKAVKFDMIKLDGSIEDKFKLIKGLGFQGVEINSPSGVNREEAVAAKNSQGIEIHGAIDSLHWQK